MSVVEVDGRKFDTVEIAGFMLRGIAEWDYRDPRRKVKLVRSLSAKFGFLRHVARYVVASTLKRINSTPVIVIDPHEVRKECRV